MGDLRFHGRFGEGPFIITCEPVSLGACKDSRPANVVGGYIEPEGISLLRVDIAGEPAPSYADMSRPDKKVLPKYSRRVQSARRPFLFHDWMRFLPSVLRRDEGFDLRHPNYEDPSIITPSATLEAILRVTPESDEIIAILKLNKNHDRPLPKKRFYARRCRVIRGGGEDESIRVPKI